MGFTVVGLGLGGLCIAMLVVGSADGYTFKNSLDVLASFGFGEHGKELSSKRLSKLQTSLQSDSVRGMGGCHVVQAP